METYSNAVRCVIDFSSVAGGCAAVGFSPDCVFALPTSVHKVTAEARLRKFPVFNKSRPWDISKVSSCRGRWWF
jgi:hypothetical protein